MAKIITPLIWSSPTVLLGPLINCPYGKHSKAFALARSKLLCLQRELEELDTINPQRPESNLRQLTYPLKSCASLLSLTVKYPHFSVSQPGGMTNLCHLTVRKIYLQIPSSPSLLGTFGPWDSGIINGRMPSPWRWLDEYSDYYVRSSNHSGPF